MSSNVDRDVELLWDQFHATVNMTSPELRSWLLTSASGTEAFPPGPDLDLDQLGLGVLHVLGKRRTDLTPEDTEVMARVITLADEWLAEPRSDGLDRDEWRHRLMSIGHDPLKD